MASDDIREYLAASAADHRSPVPRYQKVRFLLLRRRDPERNIVMGNVVPRRIVIAAAVLWTTCLAVLFSITQPAQYIPMSFDFHTRLQSIIFPALITLSTPSTRLYVASYAGTVTTLRLDLDGKAKRLRTIANTTSCGLNPSWLTIDHSKLYVYCVDEAWNWPTGSVTSFYAHDNGVLKGLASTEVIAGPVSIAEFGEGGSGLAIASYAGSGVNVVPVGPKGRMEQTQNKTYVLDKPGPVPDRQEAPHPHQAILDPTGAFVLVPDLGADLVRVYQANASSLELTPIAPLKVAPGAGPRHGAFGTAENKTYLYVVTELANTIIGYDVQYNTDRTLRFSELFMIPIHGDNRTLAVTAAGSEIQVTPDKKFLIVSSRWEYSLPIPNFDPSNKTEILSDPLIVYAIDAKTGTLEKMQEFAAGGSGPRHFSINGDGTLLAVGLQGDGRVVIIERDVETGLLKKFAASTDIAGEVNSVIFHEA